jgi:creatinine amidohydrolase
MSQKYSLFEMTRPEVEQALNNGVDTAVATFGSTEQHGLHLPLGADSMWGEVLGARVAQALGKALQAPGVRIGCSEHHMAFAGSLTLSEETFIQVVSDICHSLARHGFRRIVLLPTHGGNFKPIGKAAAIIQPQLPKVQLIAFSDLMALMEVIYKVGQAHNIPPERIGAHAGENETSMILALRPELVDMSVAEPGFVGDHLSLAPTIMEQGLKGVTENGVLGDPREATAALGELYLQALTEMIVEFVRSHDRDAN